MGRIKYKEERKVDPFSVLTGSNFMSSVSFLLLFWLEPFILLWWGKATVCGDCIAADSLLSFFILVPIMMKAS